MFNKNFKKWSTSREKKESTVKNFFKEKFLEGLQGEAIWWESNEKQVASMESFEKGFA